MCTSLLKRHRYPGRWSVQTTRSARRWGHGLRQSRKWQRLGWRFARHDSRAPSLAARDRGCRGWPETCAVLPFWLRLRSLGGFLAIDIFIADVALGVGIDRCLVDLGGRPPHFSWQAQDEGPGGKPSFLGYQFTGRDDPARHNGPPV